MSFNFTTLMSPEQIALDAQGERDRARPRQGAILYQALTVGEAILIGRTAAMEAVGTNQANGYHYVRTFMAWKAQFGFNAVPKAYLDDCMIAALSAAQRRNHRRTQAQPAGQRRHLRPRQAGQGHAQGDRGRAAAAAR
jgi:hypothetical protein